jgi:eukaryotic-like serine/threonine-protein kinase
MHKAPPCTAWEFEGFQVVTEMRLLLSGSTPVPLTSKAFDTLVLLITNRDRVVTKDELLRSVWPDVAVEEGNLTQQIFLLRKALGESAQQPRYIVTVPGHGYRFAARVKAISDESGTTDVVTDRAASRWTAGRSGSRFIGAGLVVFSSVALLVVFGSGWMAVDKAGLPLDLTNARITKVTESGKATNGAISPDGRYIAYVENDGDEYSVWVKQIATGGTTQVVPRQPNVLTHLSFSPDGEYVYFARGTPRRGTFVLSRVPAIGGLETPILDDVDTPVSFSPDGRQFVFTRGAPPLESHIVVAAAGGGSQRILATRKAPLGFSLIGPDWSPDGKVVAASATDRSTGWQWSIVVLPVDGGSSRELYTTDSRIGRVRWLPDGSGLLTVVSEALARQFPPWHADELVRLSGGTIWRIAYPDGRGERLTSDLADHDPCCLDIGANGRAVASVINSLVSDLWIAPADHLDARRQITWGNPVVSRHSWLPDNDTIVYRDLSGRLNAVYKDGRAFSLSLPDGHKVVGGVSACGDGRYVVVQTVPGNNIWRVTPNAGGAVKLTSGSLDSNPACSPDGKWVVYNSLRPDFPSLWRVPIEGGEPTPLVQGEAFDALPSPSGRLIYYSTSEWVDRPVRTRLARWNVNSSSDGKRLVGLDAPGAATFGVRPVWAPDESGLDYVVTRNGVSNIWRQPLTGGPPVQITHFSAGKIFSFAWSPDGRWLSIGAGVNRSDVLLMSRQP